jgi:MFS family permease
VAVLLYIFGDSLLIILIARLLDGLAASTVILISIARVEDNVDDKHRGKYAGISFSFAWIGKMVAPVIAGLLADRFFVKAPFLASIIILFVLILFIKRKKVKKEKIINIKILNWYKQISSFINKKKLMGMAFLGFVMHSLLAALTLFLPILIIKELGLSYSYAGYAFFAIGIPHILQILFGRLCDKNTYRYIIFGAIIYAFSAILIFISNNYYFLLIALLINGTGGGIWNVSAWTFLSKIGEKNKKEGETLGNYLAFANMGSFISFLVGGFIVTFYGIKSIFLIMGLLILVVSIISYPMIKEKRKSV